MNLAERLRDLALDGWRFWLDDGRLRFRAPDGPSRDEVLAELRAHRDEVRALLEADPTLCELAPLSGGQRALWFLWRLAPDSAAYNQSLPLRVPRGSSPAIWRRACEQLVARHPILRTLYVERNGEPVQRVSSPSAIDWAEIHTDRPSLTARLAEAHAPAFDLSAQPAVRMRWFAVADDAPVLLLTFHHIVCDGWTLEVFRRELPALADGAALAPVAATYQDFVWWQRHVLAGAEGERLRSYWRAQLAAPRPILNLPLDTARPAVQTYDGALVTAPVPEALSTALRSLAAREDTSTSVIFLAAYATMLARWSQSTDVIIGMPTSGRTRPEFAGVAGYFVEPVALRIGVGEHDTWRSLVAHAKRVMLDALAHADLPFARIVEELGVDRDASRSPIFDVSFNFNSRRLAEQTRGADHPATAVDAFEIDQAAGKFDLTFSVYEDQADTHLTLGYRRDIFERATIERVMAWLLDMLSTITVDVDGQARLTAATGGLTAVISGRRTDTNTLVPVVTTILRHADTSPDAPAVVADDGLLSYRELHERVIATAHALRTLGTRPGDAVAVLTGRHTDFVVGILGAMAAGAAFVPLDPSDPAALLERRIALADVRAIIADADSRALAETFGPPVVGDHHRATSGQVPQAPSLDDVAYIIFTSGSTGEPKGVTVGQRALANYVASIINDLSLPAGASFGFISATTADLGHTAIFPALVTGGTLHVLSERVATNPAAFASYLRDSPIDYLKIVPSHFAALAGDATGAAALPGRGVIFGGESTSWPLVERLRLAGVRVFNHYGPTETTVGVLTHADAPASARLDTLPLSRAVANTDIYLLNADGRSVPLGWPGEVHITGVALANGYVGDPTRTAERFVTLSSGARAYRTGDLARQRADGSIVLLGRNDRQIKLHGHRVELGQIDAALVGLGDVQHAVVLPDVDGPAATMLAAWVVPAPGAAPSSASVRAELSARLPRHMVPSQITIVRDIPRTANGKIDVSALRATLTAPHTSAVAAQPLDDMEWRVLQLWRDVLRAPTLAPTDDFFASGGHSLLAVRLAGRMADALGVTLPIAAFFTHRTAREMAQVLRTGAAELPTLLPLSTGAGDPLLLFPGAGGDILYFSDLVSALQSRHELWAARGLRAPRPTTVEDAAAQYLSLISHSALASRPLRLCGHSFGALIALEVARQARGTAIQIDQMIVLDQSAPTAAADDVVLARTDSEWLRHVAVRIGKLFNIPLTLPATTAGYDDGVAALVDVLHERGVLAADVRAEQFRHYVDGYKIDARAAALYHPVAAPLDVPITVYSAAIADSDLGRVDEAFEPTRGWQDHARRPVTVTTVPGTHITMLKDPHVVALAAHLTESLKETR